jgi:hypothetical protein
VKAVQSAVNAPASWQVSVRPEPCVPAVVILTSLIATAVEAVFVTPISTTLGLVSEDE